MQIDMKILGALFILGGFSVGCTGAVAPVAPLVAGAVVPVASSLRGEVGEELRVELPANPSTGFSWGFAEEPDAAILARVGEQFVPATGSLVGAGGQAVWTFRGVAPGTTSFTLVYRRVWESDVEPARRVRYQVRVESPS